MTMVYTFYDHRTTFVSGKDGKRLSNIAIHKNGIYPIPDCAEAILEPTNATQPYYENVNGQITVSHYGLYWRYTEKDLNSMRKVGAIMRGGTIIARYTPTYQPDSITISVSSPDDSFAWFDIVLCKKTIWDEMSAFFLVGPDETVVWASIENAQCGDFGSTNTMAMVLAEILQTEVKPIGEWGTAEYRLGGRYDLPVGVDQSIVQSVLHDPIPLPTYELNSFMVRQLDTLIRTAKQVHEVARIIAVGTLLVYGSYEFSDQFANGIWKSFTVPRQYYTDNTTTFAEQLVCLLPMVPILDVVLCAHISPVKPGIGVLEVHYKASL